jgi:hypothetical protein
MGKRKRGAGAGAAGGGVGRGGQEKTWKGAAGKKKMEKEKEEEKKEKKGKTVHLCAVCLYETDRKSRLTVHMRTHTGVVLILTLTLTLTSVTFDRGYCMISVSYGTDENTIIIDMPYTRCFETHQNILRFSFKSVYVPGKTLVSSK